MPYLFIYSFTLERSESQIQFCHLLMLGAALFFWKWHGSAGNEMLKPSSNIYNLRASSNTKAICISAPQAHLQNLWGTEKFVFSLLARPCIANKSERMAGTLQRVKEM